MEYLCSLRKLNLISSASDKFFTQKILEKGLPISQAHAQLFFVLPEDGTPLLFNEVATRWEISKSSLSGIIYKYETIGLIRKCICPEDKRSIYISMTAEAVHIKRALERIEDEFLAVLLQDFTEDQIHIFKEIIDRCFQNIK